jgi:hypothetical protein
MRRYPVRGAYYAAHFAMIGPALAAGMLQHNLAPAAAWIIATALLLVFGKEV